MFINNFRTEISYLKIMVIPGILVCENLKYYHANNRQQSSNHR